MKNVGNVRNVRLTIDKYKIKCFKCKQSNYIPDQTPAFNAPKWDTPNLDQNLSHAECRELHTEKDQDMPFWICQEVNLNLLIECTKCKMLRNGQIEARNACKQKEIDANCIAKDI